MTDSMTSTSDWLKNLQEEYRRFLGESPLYTAIAGASSPADFQWIRQLYYLSSDFTAAVALRYGSCQDPRFRDAFGEHAAEETTHPAELAEWMREFGFLAAGRAYFGSTLSGNAGFGFISYSRRYARADSSPGSYA